MSENTAKTPEEAFQLIQEELRSQLQKCFNPETKLAKEKEISDTVTKFLASRMEGDILGYKVTDCDVLWNLMSDDEKVLWAIANESYPQIAQDVRKRIDDDYELRVQDERIRALESGDDPDDYYIMPPEYPVWAEPDPKTKYVVKATVKLNTPIEFINVNLDLKGLDAQLREEE